jgi:APA family basic amino acid/polyamine antiporter
VLSATGLALIPVMFTYSGWNAASYIASEVREPEKTLPQSLALGTLITIGVYLTLNILYLYALPVAALSGVVQVGEQTAHALFGPAPAKLVSALIALSIASAFNVMILTGGRIYFAMASDGVFFPRAYTTVVLVSVSAVTVSAVFVLRRRKPDLPRPYRVWGYPWLPALYVLGSVGIFVNALWERPVECLLGVGLCAAGVPAYWWWRRVDSSGRGG